MPPHITVFIAPMASGKSTFVGRSPSTRRDSDDARLPAHEAELTRLREQRDWPRHNRIWHNDLKAWASKLPSSVEAITAHSMADALAIMNGLHPRLARPTFVILPQPVHDRRADKRCLDPEERSLKQLNRQTVIQDAVAYPFVPRISDFPS